MLSGLDPTPQALINSPLDFLMAEHMRQRTACALLRKFAINQIAESSEASRVAAFLTHDVPLHYADEKDDLFPALRRRAREGDDFDALFARIGAGEKRGAAVMASILRALSVEGELGCIPISPPAQQLMLNYAATEHRRIALENAVVLTIAGVRLNRNDLRAISASMKLRRGITDA